MNTYITMQDLIGLTFVKITSTDEEVRFTTDDGDEYLMYHDQDCCENVELEEVVGDITDLLDTPILFARESSDENRDAAEQDLLDGEEYVMHKLGSSLTEEDPYDSQTWTFYLFSTIKGSVTMRWYGSSNGYYSESVSLKKLATPFN
jgi:hypothetical protein